ncbi:hypothetical protein [Legionella londiniensis]|uniref:Uncharacterized protein n=1 Tax=Legionella londiniensis TaxID=45068 RepID=A0A0W0VIK0_9GAMM|nr:hypothetical protein [Legionella londiniensis]KTD19914.1 hypothetical protein Llon_2086 [Legionella londiniensis]STX94214.1 Uncharacterised protein [Legionella londiniensis]
MPKGKEFISLFTKSYSSMSKSSLFQESVKVSITNYSKISYFKLTSEERRKGYQEVIASLPESPDFVYRGTTGNAEVLHAIETGCLGRAPKECKKSDCLNLVAYVEKNDSKFFYSTTPCPTTVMGYTEGLSVIPTVGNILVMNQPKVFVRPQKMLVLYPEMFSEYDEKNYQSIAYGDGPRQIPIAERTLHNNEVTGILGLSVKDDWRLTTSKDLAKIIQVYAPGRLLGLFMSAKEPVHVQQWDNPQFRKRACSLEVMVDNGHPQAVEVMNERAVEFGLINKNQRLLTLKDAYALLTAEEFARFEDYETEHTELFSEVPKEIREGDAKELFDYTQSIMDSKQMGKSLSYKM